MKIVIQSSVTRNTNMSNTNKPVCWKVCPHYHFIMINKFNSVLRNRIRFEILSSMSKSQPDINFKPNTNIPNIPIWKHEIYPDKDIHFLSTLSVRKGNSVDQQNCTYLVEHLSCTPATRNLFFKNKQSTTSNLSLPIAPQWKYPSWIHKCSMKHSVKAGERLHSLAKP